ncbi:MAG TPA: hypothetical protein VG942_15845 [Hyphomonadaceae bacterium]|nr:hypothetical protein [Hyphomonadaceae bacterium]
MKSITVGIAATALMLAASPAALAQAGYSGPHTSWGAPDLQGFWTFSSITKLTRPAGIDHLVLTPAEAKAIEEKDFNNARTKAELKPTDQSLGAPVGGKALPAIGNYNAVWVDPGSQVARINGEYRSSWITDPPNGKVPFSDAGRKKMATWKPDATRDGTFKPDPSSLNIYAPPASKATLMKPNGKAAAKTPASKAAKAEGGSSGNGQPAAKTFVDLVEAPKSADNGGAADSYRGPESRGTGERCISMNGGGPVMLSGLYNNNAQIVQTPDHVMIEVEMIHDARIIPLVKDKAAADAHFKDTKTVKWYGDSVGWYEGDTLVVQTRNYNHQQAGQVFISDTGKLTERFTRVGPEDIVYGFTVEDPEVYTQVWKGEISFRSIQGPIYEYACHEGNYGLYDILLGAREQERQGRKLAATGTEE